MINNYERDMLKVLAGIEHGLEKNGRKLKRIADAIDRVSAKYMTKESADDAAKEDIDNA